MLRSKLCRAWPLCKDLSAKQVSEIVDENFLKVALSPRAAANLPQPGGAKTLYDLRGRCGEYMHKS